MRTAMNPIGVLLLFLIPVFGVAQEAGVGDIVDKYMSSEAPFALIGRWTLLVPTVPEAFDLQTRPERFSDVFQLIYIELEEDGTALLTVPGSTEVERYTWEHAWSGPRFYVRLTEQVVLRFAYFVSREYVSDDLRIDTWSSIKNAWHIGQVETERGMLGYEMMMGNETERVTERIEELEHEVGPISSATLPVIMSTLIDTVEQGAAHGILTRRTGIR